MRQAENIAAQPAAFRTTDSTPCFTRLPQFPDEMEAIQLPRTAFERFAEKATAEGIQFLGGLLRMQRSIHSCLRPRASGCERNCTAERWVSILVFLMC